MSRSGSRTARGRSGVRYLSVLLLFCLFLCMFPSCGQPPATDGEDLPPLRIGSDDYAPFFYMDENGEFAGMDVALATEVCRRLGYRVEFVRIDWTKKDILLAAGEVDCLWGSFSMTGREDRYIWAGPYMNSRQVVVVPEDSDIHTLSDLAGRRVAVQATSKPDEIFSSGTDERIPPLRDLYCFENMKNVFAALRKGYVDAIAGHETAFRDYMRYTYGNYRVLDEHLLVVHLGVAFDKNGDGVMAGKVKATLDEMKNDGFTQEILRAYGIDSDFALEDDGWAK